MSQGSSVTGLGTGGRQKETLRGVGRTERRRRTGVGPGGPPRPSTPLASSTWPRSRWVKYGRVRSASRRQSGRSGTDRPPERPRSGHIRVTEGSGPGTEGTRKGQEDRVDYSSGVDWEACGRPPHPSRMDDGGPPRTRHPPQGDPTSGGDLDGGRKIFLTRPPPLFLSESSTRILETRLGGPRVYRTHNSTTHPSLSDSLHPTGGAGGTRGWNTSDRSLSFPTMGPPPPGSSCRHLSRVGTR